MEMRFAAKLAALAAAAVAIAAPTPASAAGAANTVEFTVASAKVSSDPIVLDVTGTIKCSSAVKPTKAMANSYLTTNLANQDSGTVGHVYVKGKPQAYMVPGPNCDGKSNTWTLQLKEFNRKPWVKGEIIHLTVQWSAQQETKWKFVEGTQKKDLKVAK